MKVLIKSLLVLFIILSAKSCILIDVKKGMVHFDQAFIPVYYHTWKGELAEARNAAFNLEYQWQHFQNRYKSILPEDEIWQESFRRTQSWLDDANAALETNMQEFAIAQLDHARYEMMELRRQKGIYYYLDDLYNFQMDLSEVYETGSDDMLCLMEWSEFELLVNNLNENWCNILEKPFDNELFEFTKFETSRMEMMERMIAFQLEDALVALDCGNHFEVAKKVEIVENTFMKMLTDFGKFPNEDAIAFDI